MSEIIYCQSCGMPLETEAVIGTNADGSKNEEYCVWSIYSRCYDERNDCN